MKWSKSKVLSLIGATSLLITAVLFAGPYKEKAGFIFNWFIDGVKYMELDTTGLKADNISDLAGTGSPDFQNGLNIDDEPTLVAEYMTATTTPGAPAPGSAVFYSEIVGRQPMLDLSKIPSGKFGVERVIYTSYPEVNGESGAAGEVVLSPPDIHNRVRLVGNWNVQDNTNGFFAQGTSSSYMEITCYCTGLNSVTFIDPTDRRTIATVDGGTPEAAKGPAGGQNILTGRKYDGQQVYNMVSGMPLGIHTVKITAGGSDMIFRGIEFLNDATTVAIPSGSIVYKGKRFITPATTDDLTTFQNKYQDGVASGSSTKGGHQVRYFDIDGTIKKDINYADSSQLDVSAASHANEKLVQSFNFRDFSAGRVDDFSQTGNPLDLAFTLDDGTTTLVADEANVASGIGDLGGGFGPNNGGSFTLTFVGTGLDIEVDTFGGALANNCNLLIDGSSIFSGASSTAFGTTSGFKRIVSGLPFGTHTFRYSNTAAGTGPFFRAFNIYAPKKPVLADGQVEIDSTYKMADFVGDTLSGSTYTGGISQGTIRQTNTRGAIYDGGGGSFLMQLHMSESTTGFEAFNSTATSAYSFTFWGTGFTAHLRSAAGRSANQAITVNGTALTSGNFGTVTAASFGNPSFNFGTGSLNIGGAAGNGGMNVSGLPLGLYTVEYDNVSGGFSHFLSYDIITPTYSYKNNLLNTNDALVGNSSLKNEILVPGATKHKIIATEGIDLGPNKIKWKNIPIPTYEWTAVQSGNQYIIPETRVSLTVGHTYRFTWSNTFTTISAAWNGDHSAQVHLFDGGALVSTLRHTVDNWTYPGAGFVPWSTNLSEAKVYTVVNNDIYLRWDMGQNVYMLYDNAKFTVEELPNHIEVDNF